MAKYPAGRTSPLLRWNATAVAQALKAVPRTPDAPGRPEVIEQRHVRPVVWSAFVRTPSARSRLLLTLTPNRQAFALRPRHRSRAFKHHQRFRLPPLQRHEACPAGPCGDPPVSPRRPLRKVAAAPVPGCSLP